MKRTIYSLICLVIISYQAIAQNKLSNPLLSGYFADPTVVLDKGKYFIYATIDPWGGKELAVFETKDFLS
ncbi:MAG: hypothetical protein EOO90_25355, partial [Pedobacter sp.]